MPVCGFVSKFKIVPHPKRSGCLRVSVWYSGNSPEIFSELVREAFPKVGIFSEQSRKKFLLV